MQSFILPAALVSMLALSACTEAESETDTGTYPPATDTVVAPTATATATATTTESPQTTPVATVPLTAWVSDFLGNPILQGQLCSDFGCTQINNVGSTTIDVEQNAEVAVWVSYPGSVNAQFQFRSSDQDIIVNLIAPRIAEAKFVAEKFGVVIDPSLAIISQLVIPTSPVTPALNAPADGPYIIDLDGFPTPGTTLPVSGGFYVFFNVDPGAHVVDLPGCDEGVDSWGAPNDQQIDVDVSAGQSLGVFTVICL